MSRPVGTKRLYQAVEEEKQTNKRQKCGIQESYVPDFQQPRPIRQDLTKGLTNEIKEILEPYIGRTWNQIKEIFWAKYESNKLPALDEKKRIILQAQIQNYLQNRIRDCKVTFIPEQIPKPRVLAPGPWARFLSMFRQISEEVIRKDANATFETVCIEFLKRNHERQYRDILLIAKSDIKKAFTKRQFRKV